MKKWFAGMMAGALAAVICVSFAACGEKGLDAESIEGKEVTEAQWNAAFDELLSEDAVYTVRGEVTSESTFKKGEYQASVTIEYSGYAEKTASAGHMFGNAKLVDYSGDVKEFFDEEEYEDIVEQKGSYDYKINRYAEKTEGGAYWYEMEPETNQWVRARVSDYELPLENYLSSLRKECKDNFDRFHYDAEKKGYILTSIETRGERKYENTVIKFNDEGKLVAIFGDEGEHGFSDRKIVFHFVVEYTAEEIVFPTDYVEK